MAGEANRVTAMRLAESHSVGTPDDEELLDRVLGCDPETYEEAFRTLISRHGPMVLGVCRQILGQEHDAEDVFQATFLVLARGAASIRDKRALGGWLHGVAYRLAVRVKTGAARRRVREKEAAKMLNEEDQSERAWGDLRPVLHEEVNRLPEAYRNAVVLCYLEGRTNEEAAALLRCPIGTVKGRLSRARVLLHSRLTRRGVALSAVFLIARPSPEAVFAEVVPSVLSGTTIRAVVAFARDGSARLADTVPFQVQELVAHDFGPTSRITPRARTALFLLFLVTTAAILFGGVTAASGNGDVAYRRILGFFTDRPGARVPGACHGTR
jgi:RNA polymerase sigma factor (sigma-70 family)